MKTFSSFFFFFVLFCFVLFCFVLFCFCLLFFCFVLFLFVCFFLFPFYCPVLGSGRGGKKQRKAARFVCKDYRRKSSVSYLLINDKKFGMEVTGRTPGQHSDSHYFTSPSITRLLWILITTRLYHSKSEGGGIKTRKSSSISFTHPSSNKDCYKYSFIIPRTTAEWNHLPASIRGSCNTVQVSKTNLGEIQMSAFIRGGTISLLLASANHHACNLYIHFGVCCSTKQMQMK